MRRPTNRLPQIAIVAAALLLVAACDTGDGKTLREPTGTLPPPTVATTTTLLTDGVETTGVLPAEDASGQRDAPVDAEPSAFRLNAPWGDGEPIDALYTCDGDDISPTLNWLSPPAGSSELALVVEDESIPGGVPFVHWVVAGISPQDMSLNEGSVPVGAVQALNFFGDLGWGGPCPPAGDPPHTYRFTIYALNQQVELADGTPASDLLDLIKTVSIASADVTGTFQR